ncbi:MULTISPECIES: hypothetical protein [Methylobacterium]|uniref:hypothetical protein n=1 Tax=Methylobacterium TaxID=407 RepID=UPI0013EDE803|nr:hypothetical protein [Methylobacterium sp. DB0501]NGM38674.1 hypothetical protein [Methylobacterium sp. DB0501]
MNDAALEIYQAISDLNKRLKQGSFTDIAEAVAHNLGNQELHTILSSMLVNASLRHRNSDLTHRLVNVERIETSSMSSIQMPVGMVSSDGSAILGRDGFMFLIGGSNDVLAQYAPTRPGDLDVATQWIALVDNRLERAAQAGVRFHQVIVPEKISILPDLYPTPISSPTRLLDHIEAEMRDRHGSAIYTSVRGIFWSLADRTIACRRADSHLSPYGTYLVFKHLMNELFDLRIPAYRFDKATATIGDLSYRMIGLFVPEIFYEVDTADLPHFCDGVEKSDEYIPEDGSHMGRRQIWKNPKAPIDEKVVVFGNSFFSFAENGQGTLSWWFARWFREFHFVWTNEIDWDYVVNEKPGVVFWQGIERFLGVIPQQ